VGIWEYQVENLDEQLIRDMNEYLPTFVDLETWQKSPQLRTIPVGRSVETTLEVLSYESAEELVKAQSKIRLLPCICRREHRMVGEGCDKPEESCLVFGMGAYYYERRGIGRDIDVEECLQVLQRADEAGLVLQPNNAQKLNNLCCCCGCCCQVLIYLNRHPKPAQVVSTPFIVAADPETCVGCGVCVDRCQMNALSLDDDDLVVLDTDRCIGCGLCVSTCPSESLTLVRKPQGEQPYVPANMMESHMQLARVRGKLGPAKMAKMQLRSKWDRYLAGK
jgi:ferredoxin